MSHSRIGHWKEVDSWLLVVGSQIGNSTPGPSFGHNLCYRCLNEQCEPILDIYASRAFHWYEERRNPLRFGPCNRSLKFWESTETPSPQVGVALGVWVFTPSHSLALSCTPGSMWCDSQASSWLNSRASFWLNSRASLWLNSRASLWLNSRASLWLNSRASLWLNSRASLWLNSRASLWPAPLQFPLPWSRAQARVATLSPTRRRGQCPHWHLEFFCFTVALPGACDVTPGSTIRPAPCNPFALALSQG